jgi:hypothetical protein
MKGFTVLRWLSTLLPRRLRSEYGREVLDLLEAGLSHAATEGRRKALRVWLRGARDLAATAVRGRLRPGAITRLSGRRRNGRLFGAFGADVWQTPRSLGKTPRFVVLVVMLLALGIGATTTVFSVMEAALIRPLPFPQPDRLVRIGVRRADNPAVGPPPVKVVAAWKFTVSADSRIE